MLSTNEDLRICDPVGVGPHMGVGYNGVPDSGASVSLGRRKKLRFLLATVAALSTFAMLMYITPASAQAPECKDTPLPPGPVCGIGGPKPGDAALALKVEVQRQCYAKCLALLCETATDLCTLTDTDYKSEKETDVAEGIYQVCTPEVMCNCECDDCAGTKLVSTTVTVTSETPEGAGQDSEKTAKEVARANAKVWCAANECARYTCTDPAPVVCTTAVGKGADGVITDTSEPTDGNWIATFRIDECKCACLDPVVP